MRMIWLQAGLLRFVIENTSSTRVVKVFTTVMKTIFSKIRPGCTFPDDTDEVEEANSYKDYCRECANRP